MLYAIFGTLIAGLATTFAIFQIRKRLTLLNKNQKRAHDAAIMATTPIPLLLMILIIRNDKLFSDNGLAAEITYLGTSFAVTLAMVTIVGLACGYGAYAMAGAKSGADET